MKAAGILATIGVGAFVGCAALAYSEIRKAWKNKNDETRKKEIDEAYEQGYLVGLYDGRKFAEADFRKKSGNDIDIEIE